MDTRYCPRFVSGLPREGRPDFYLEPDYWAGVSKAVVVVDPATNELVGKIVAAAKSRGIPIAAETKAIGDSLLRLGLLSQEELSCG